MTTPDERVRLVARYLEAWRVHDVACRRYDDHELALFGPEAVRTADALDDLVEAGIISRETLPGLKPIADVSRLTADDREVIQQLAGEATRSQRALVATLEALAAAMAQDGRTPYEAPFDDLLAWAGADLDTLEGVLVAARTGPSLSGSG